MATPVIKGLSSPLFQDWEQTFSPTQGVHTRQTYMGTDIVQMSALAQTYVQAGYSGTLKYSKNVATLTLNAANFSIAGQANSYSPSQNVVDKWEVAVDQEKPELFENPQFLSLVQANDSTSTSVTGYNLQSFQIISAMKQAANEANYATSWTNFYNIMKGQMNDQTGTPIAGSSEPLSQGINLLGSFPNIKNFYDDYVKGRTNFLRGKYSLRHTTSAPNNYSANVADFNVEKIYSISQLLSEAGDPTLWILPLPGYLAYKILSYPVPLSMPPNYMWGALKERSGAIVAARNRIEITTEYLIDACPIHTYGTKS